MKRLLITVAAVSLCLVVVSVSAETDQVSACSIEVSPHGNNCHVTCPVGTPAICEKKGDATASCRCGAGKTELTTILKKLKDLEEWATGREQKCPCGTAEPAPVEPPEE